MIVLGLISLILALPAQAQKRNPDLILTVKKDTLSVKIAEVGISDVKYRHWTGDTVTIYTIAKIEVAKVFYGNGDEEEFKPSTPVRRVPADRRYYKMKVKTPFQKEIALWSTEKLMTERGVYGQKYRAQKTGGVVAISVGGAAAVVGFVHIFGGILSALFSFGSNDEYNPKPATVAIVSGIAVSTGAGIPLTILGSKNKKKYNAIKMELEMRGVLAD